LFGKLAPARYAATVIAVWFFAGAGGNLLGGVIGVYWTRAESVDFFAILALLALLTGALLLSRSTSLENLQRRSK
jgi:dipeptide/tripeptide permease